MLRTDAQLAAADKAAQEWPLHITHDRETWEFVSLAPHGGWYFAQPNRFLLVTPIEGRGATYHPELAKRPHGGWFCDDAAITDATRLLPACPFDIGTVHPDNALAQRARRAYAKMIETRDHLTSKLDRSELGVDDFRLAEWFPADHAKWVAARTTYENLRTRLDAQLAKADRVERSRRLRHEARLRRTDHSIVLASRKTLVMAVSR